MEISGKQFSDKHREIIFFYIDCPWTVASIGTWVSIPEVFNQRLDDSNYTLHSGLSFQLHGSPQIS